jgi:hypothetical protein
MRWPSWRGARGLLSVPLLLSSAGQPAVLAQQVCGEACPRHHCPPPYVHCTESPPCIKFKCAYPKPVCPPDWDTPGWGYFEPSWRPWPWQRNHAHCPVPTPAALAAPCGAGNAETGPYVTPALPAAGEPVPPRPIDPTLRKGP